MCLLYSERGCEAIRGIYHTLPLIPFLNIIDGGCRYIPRFNKRSHEKMNKKECVEREIEKLYELETLLMLQFTLETYVTVLMRLLEWIINQVFSWITSPPVVEELRVKLSGEELERFLRLVRDYKRYRNSLLETLDEVLRTLSEITDKRHREIKKILRDSST